MTMATDEEKCKLEKLLRGLEVPEVRLPERSLGLVKEFQKRFGAEIAAEPTDSMEEYENPYLPEKELLEDNERKLVELLSENRRAKRAITESVVASVPDPKRPWRTHSSKERLLRIDGELKRHSEKGIEAMPPLNDEVMKDLVEECRQEQRGSPTVGVDRLRDTVEEARKHLPNFQYRTIQNTTATAILPSAHQVNAANVVNEE